MAKINEKETNIVDINNEREIRLKKMQELKENNINPFPATAERTHSTADALNENEGTKVCIGGRIILKRDIGKLTFCTLQDESGRMQIALKQDDLGKETYSLFTKKIDLGDIIQVTGERFKTHTGEESVLV